MLGMASAIPLFLFVSVGCLVRLTKNLFLPKGYRWGLFNGAQGKVKEIIYEEGVDVNNALPKWIVVHFKHYKGPQFFSQTQQKNWVPIPQISLLCDSFTRCCERSGFPLIVEKGKTVHSFQGLTVREGKSMRRMIVHLDTDMEAKNPDLTYTAFSRVKRLEDFAVVSKASLDRNFFFQVRNSPGQCAAKRRNSATL